jgi:hypothetical protein
VDRAPSGDRGDEGHQVTLTRTLSYRQVSTQV